MRSVVGRYGRRIVWVALLPIVACAPKPTSLEPASGPPLTLVTVQGSELELTSVIWDAGLPTQQEIPTSFGWPMFTVPLNATAGAHPIAFAGPWGRSTALNYTVTTPTGGPALKPRIDRVTVVSAQFQEGNVTPLLYVQGANLDVGSVVSIDGNKAPTIAHKAIANDTFNIPPAFLGFPIGHYLSDIVVAGARPVGQSVSIVVTNLDGSTSDAVTFTMPMESTLDRDGDALPDAWEMAGYDADGDGQSDAHVLKPDVFVELDLSDKVSLDAAASGQPGALDAVYDMFNAAPIINPLDSNGINLIVDASERLAGVDYVHFDTPQSAGASLPSGNVQFFSALKQQHFNHASLGDVFHYVVWGARLTSGYSGDSDNPPLGPYAPSDDSAIGLDGLGPAFHTARSQAEILAHELGHQLGQRHGGDSDDPWTPSYWSVMSYTWVLRTSRSFNEWRQYATCLPMYYTAAAAHETPNQTTFPPTRVTMSAGTGRTIVESQGPFDERKGVCGQPVDWDEDGRTQSVATIDGNDDGDSTDSLTDYPNWVHLQFDGPLSNGTIP